MDKEKYLDIILINKKTNERSIIKNVHDISYYERDIDCGNYTEFVPCFALWSDGIASIDYALSEYRFELL